MDFYDALIKPKPLFTNPKCGIGSICFSQFETDFVVPVACPVQYAVYRIDVEKNTVGGKFKSPTVAEHSQYILQKKSDSGKSMEEEGVEDFEDYEHIDSDWK